MPKKIYHFFICLMIISSYSFTQWAGSTPTSGTTYRDGDVDANLKNQTIKP